MFLPSQFTDSHPDNPGSHKVPSSHLPPPFASQRWRPTRYSIIWKEPSQSSKNSSRKGSSHRYAHPPCLHPQFTRSKHRLTKPSPARDQRHNPKAHQIRIRDPRLRQQSQGLPAVPRVRAEHVQSPSEASPPSPGRQALPQPVFPRSADTLLVGARDVKVSGRPQAVDGVSRTCAEIAGDKGDG